MKHEGEQPEELTGPEKATLDMATVRARLAAAPGHAYWRGLDELARTTEFQEFLYREFPRQASAWTEGMSRRAFLTLSGAALALAGLSGCQPHLPDEPIVPYVKQPDGLTPGVPLYFATAIVHDGYAHPVVVTSREGRPIKIEGNPDHPASLGKTDAITQAALLSLYDPDRSQEVLHNGLPDNYDDCLAAIVEQMAAETGRQGAGMRLITGRITSPTLIAQMRHLLSRFPQARWCQYEPVDRSNERAGAMQAFGVDVSPIYHFDRAEAALSLDADFLLTLPGHVRYAADFAGTRRVRQSDTHRSRLYAVESIPTITGAMADNRLAVRPAAVEPVARAIEAAAAVGAAAAPAGSEWAGWAQAAAADLLAHRGGCVVVAGERQPAAVHALAHRLNAALGNDGRTVEYIDPVAADAGAQAISLPELAAEMRAGQVQTLMILDSNPAYASPADLAFTEALAKVPFSLHLGSYADETAVACIWHVPQTHTLESWGDARAYEGTVSLIQPLIAPLYATHTAHELVAAMSGQIARSDLDIVRDYWRTQHKGPDFEAFWRKSLNDGLVAGTTAPIRRMTARTTTGAAAPPTGSPAAGAAAGDAAARGDKTGELDIVFAPDPTVWDGRYANNAWLQELPKPLNKLTWDNAAIISPRTAELLKLDASAGVTLRYRGRSVEATVWVLPGQPDSVVTVHLGYGRTRAGNIGSGTGFNGYALRTSDAPWFGAGLEMVANGKTNPLACTHSHWVMDGRDIVRAGTLEQFRRDPSFIHAHDREPERPHSLYPDWHYPEYAWAMSIDLNTCIGCNACVVACQAENNIPSVGKLEVLRGREMHWLRIDRYYEGKDLDAPTATYFMPIPCMHCEHAPCELVCPVGATLHNRDGLNQMVYNRCVGTRYCSNNCPYKVRRFNFLHYTAQPPSDYEGPLLSLMMNPEVTVRSRGVMEKCTYCVQRIENAKIQADKENRLVRDGEITTACAQACPTTAIVFGNMADRQSAVSKLKREPHDYALLAELDTRPRTSYLARIMDPDPMGKAE
jgi:molybdopterin-containing oxidoreductase family iron-sulfur binding subunit